MKKLVYILATVSLLLFISLCVSLLYIYNNVGIAEEKVSDVTYVDWKEKKVTEPTEKLEKVVGTIKVPVRSKINENRSKINDSCSNVSDSVPKVAENCTEQTDSVELELTQKVYSDSTYTAYVSGYRPNLDSIFVRQKEVYRTITVTKTIKEKEFRRWNVGLIGGYGYGFSSKQFEPFVGVGVTYNIFK